jgi:hypothetical protein
MNAIPFRTKPEKSRPAQPGVPPADRPVDMAWIVLEAANDLGDHATIEICCRVIDAWLNGREASTSDLHAVVNYFR